MEYRNTKQYRSIYNYVAISCTHPTAEEVYLNVSKEFPNISLKTVYRNLNKMAQEGKIIRILIPNQPDRFDKTTANHYHLCCSKCGEFMDMDMEYQTQLNSLVESKSGYKKAAHSIIFNGVCPKCLKNN